MNRNDIRVAWGLLLMLLWGCQTVLAPLGMQKPTADYIKKAQAYERQGNLVDALEQYKLAQTVDPNETQVNERINYLERKLTDLAEAHYQAGLRFRDKGKWRLAKKEFLETLRYRPNYKNAAAMLQQRQPSEATKFIVHKIAPGESISKLALKFYGDYKKYYHIANFNNLSNAARVRVGQRILIPVIAGVSIDDLRRIESSTTAKPSPAPSPSAPEPAAAPPSTGEPSEMGAVIQTPEAPADLAEPSQPESSEPADQVAAYRQSGIALFNEKNYSEAILELQKVLNAVPDDADAMGYISRSYVEMGKTYLADNRIDEAKSAFATALQYDKNCRDCQDLLTRSRTIEATALRKEGERYLKKNQFDNASAALEQALTLNPNDATAADLLFRSYFQKAQMLYNKQDYLAASASFRKAVAVKPDCSDCQQYIDDSMEAYKDYYYNEGIIHFGQEELKKAITAWKKVEAVDPDYKDIQQNLKKATLLNDRLERIRKSTTK